MILGKITGKTSTLDFAFEVSGNPKKFDYIQIIHEENYILAQIVELEREKSTIAFCHIIGYREDKILKQLLTPPEPGTEVLKAEDNFIKETLGLKDDKSSAYLGTLKGYDELKVYLDLNKLLTKHCCVLAKSGSGKCLAPNTKILLSDGRQLNIGKLVDKHLKLGSHIKDNVEYSTYNPKNLLVISIDNNNQQKESEIRAFMRRKSPEKLIQLKTRSGKTLILTEEHPIPVMDEGIKWVRAKNLKLRDYMCTLKPAIRCKSRKIDLFNLWKKSHKNRICSEQAFLEIKNKIVEKGITFEDLSKELGYSRTSLGNWFKERSMPVSIFIRLCSILEIDIKGIRNRITHISRGKKKIPSIIEINKDSAKLFSYMLAEGHNNGRVITFTNSSKEIMKEYSDLVYNVFGEKVHRTDYNEVRIYNTLLAQSLLRLGFTRSSWTKYINQSILSSNEKVLWSFLETFIDCDGHVCKNTPSLEIALASKKMIKGLSYMMLRLNLICIIKNKLIKGRYYPKLTISGSKNLKELNENMRLLVSHKKERLEKFSKLNSNTNIEVIPNITGSLKRVVKALNLSFNETRVAGISNYLNRKDSPSWSSLNRLLDDFESKYTSLKSTIYYIKGLCNSLPQINELETLDLISDYHNKNRLSFETLSMGSSVSGTTVRRMLRKITKPTNNVYSLASSLNIEYHDFAKINNLDFKSLCLEIKNLCVFIGYEIKTLSKDVNIDKCALQRYCSGITDKPLYSTVYNLFKRLNEIAEIKKEQLKEARNILNLLHSMVNSNLFFDEIISIRAVKSRHNYVYDLETEQHNFVANSLIVHNSYAAACLVEEILEREIPLLIIDPHAEYSTLKQPNDKDKESLLKFKITPKSYRNINEYSPDPEINKSSRQLKLNSNNISSSELIHLLPAKLSNAQLGLLYSALKSSDNKADFDRLIYELEAEENPGKYTIINIIEYLKKLDLFSEFPTSLQELIQPGKCSIISLKGIDPELQEVVVYKLMKDLFDARKRNNIPPFFAVIEEAHNYLPERNFGEAKSSAILRQISSEGRKFGLGLCIISQRPSRVDKSCISQATTQIILKITNPNDLKSISNSVESITSETEKEIRNLPIGTALVTGVVDLPLFVNIRPRRTKHGGEAVNILEAVIPKTFSQSESNQLTSSAETEAGELVNVIRQRNTKKDIELMSQEKIKTIKTILIPCLFISIKDNNILVNLNTGELINNQETGSGISFLKKLDLSINQKKVFDTALTLKQFTAAELFAKSSVQFSEIYETINALITKGYLQKENNKLKLSDSFSLSLEDFSFPDYPDYSRIEYEKKLEKKFPAEEILKFLKTLTEIKNSKECWLAIYQVEYAD